jgi:peptidoglycan/xylan/chitin deacetylase (PgdA/CDA1 family)
MIRLLCFLFHDVYERDPSESGFPGGAADRYKLPAAAFERQLHEIARVRADAPLVVDGRVPSARGHDAFAITVDDGGVSLYTQVAERLERLGWKAHGFVTTGCIGHKGFLDPSQIRDLHRRGHAIGSHSVSHPTRFAALSAQEMAREWADSRAALQDLLGEDVTVASVPGGYYTPRVAATASQAGFRALFTSEPETRVRVVEGCLVIGRFTLRRVCRDDLGARLARRQRSALVREWVMWNGKKAVKGVLGAAYPRLAAAAAAKAR